MAFVATNKAPGVYIDEINVPGPIPGVGTSTAAFVGPALQGPIKIPTFLTSFTQFLNAFGSYITAPQVFVTHAVKGFFDNGGATCYFVRVGTAVQASRNLNDRSTGLGNSTLAVKAKGEGVAGNAITVEVQDASIVSAVAASRAQATLTSASNNQATVTLVADAANFRPGDIVSLQQTTPAASERATIDSISNATITFRANLANTYTGGTIRIADLVLGQKVIRAASTTDIEPGSYISITQGTTTESGVVQSVERSNNYITLTQGLGNIYTMAATDAVVNFQTLEFTLVIFTPAATPGIAPADKGSRRFEKLAMDPRHSRYFAKVIDSSSVEVTLVDTPTGPPNNRPRVLAAALAGGLDDNITQIQGSDYQSGIDTLEKVDDVNILCVPDRTDQIVQTHMIEHCERMQDRFAILDPQPNASPTTGITAQRDQVSSDRGYAALYYPWVFISNPLASGQIKVPPSGHIAGVYARSDNSRGVHKAPANESLRGVLALERTLTDAEQGPLNEKGINVIRSFTGQGIRIWGARTIAPPDRTAWRYINVRRLMLFIEESLQEGTAFAVFEPNNLALWQTVKRQAVDFLTRVWRDGALFGATPDKAFRVRIDEDLNPPSVRALGQLVIEVIVFPVTPAEFIVFQIIQKPGGGGFDEI